MICISNIYIYITCLVFFCLLKVFDMKKTAAKTIKPKETNPFQLQNEASCQLNAQSSGTLSIVWRPSQCHGPLALPGAVLFGTRRCGTTPTLPAPVSRAWLAICLWQMSWGILFGGEKGLGEMSSRISFCFIDHIDVFLCCYLFRGPMLLFLSSICSGSWDY